MVEGTRKSEVAARTRSRDGASGCGTGSTRRCECDAHPSSRTGGWIDATLRDPGAAVDTTHSRHGYRASRIRPDRPSLRRDASAVRVREGEEDAGADLPAHAAARESPRSSSRRASRLGVPLERVLETRGHHLRRTLPELPARVPRVGPLPLTFSVGHLTTRPAVPSTSRPALIPGRRRSGFIGHGS